VRQRLFELTKPVKLTAAEFTTYWPFVDNFWVTSNKSGLNQWYRCRLGLKKDNGGQGTRRTKEEVKRPTS